MRALRAVTRRAMVAVVVLAVVTSLVVGGTPNAEANPAVSAAQTGERSQLVSDQVAAELGAVLQGRATARSAADVDAVLATLSDFASAELRDTERRSVLQGGELGVVEWRETLVEPVVDLSPPDLPSDQLVVAVDRRWRVDGVDTWDRASTVVYTFQQGSDGWRIVADDTLDRLGLASDRQLWELTDVEVVRSDRVLVVGDAGRNRLDAVAEVTSEAIRRFDARWDPEWDRSWAGTVMVVVPDGIRRLEQLLRPTGDASRFVAFTTLDVDRSDGWDVVAPRIVTQESNLSRRELDRQIEVMVHELVHVASVRESGPATPLWLHEGFADWVTASRPVADGELVFPDLYVFRTGDVSDISAAYAQAAQTMAVLAGDLGSSAVWELFERTGDLRSAPGSADHLVSTVIDDLVAAVG